MRKITGFVAVAFFFLLLFQNCQKSDFTVITGVVTDSVSTAPIPQAMIYVDGRYYFTDQDGLFQLDGIQPGKYTLYVSCRSAYTYKSSRKDIIISGGRVNKIDLTLSPVPEPEIETGKVTNISRNSATITATANVHENISFYGHCWSYSTPFPTLGNSVDHTRLSGDGNKFTFQSSLSNLENDVVYYIRAYIVTSSGRTVYGNSVAFRTSQRDIDMGLIYYFPFDGDFLDHSGNAFFVRPDFNSPDFVSDRFGTHNYACSFSNSQDLYGYGTPGLSDFTVSLWFMKETSWENAQQHFFQIGDQFNNDYTFFIRQDISPDVFNAGIRVNNIVYKISLNTYPSLNHWHHVLVMRKGSVLYLYLDGFQISSINCPSATLPPTGYFNIGAGWVTYYQQYQGKLDEVRLYNRSLSDSEIQYLYTH